MKRIAFIVAALLLLVGCKPEPVEVRHDRDITYTVNSDSVETTTVHLTTEAEWQALLDRFCDYAEGGSTVTFRNANRAAKAAAKEVVTYSTTDREAMKRWMAQMEDEGMTVTVTYDPATGTWHGTAYATAPQPHDCYTGTLVEVPNPQMEEGPNLPGMVMALQINDDSTLIIANGGHWFWDGYLPLSDSSAIYPGGPITLCGTVEARQDYNGDTFLQLEIGPGPQPAPTPNPVPHPNGGVLTYVCDASPMWRIIMSIDTVNNYIYATGMMYDSINTFVGYNLLVPEGVCTYHWFNPADSGFGSYADRAWLYIQNANVTERAAHYYITGNLDFGNGFALHYADNAPQDLNTITNFEFVRTDDFPISVHRSDECDIIIHTHDNANEGQSYVFSRVNCPLPFENGKFTMEPYEWYYPQDPNAPYFRETITLRYGISGNTYHFGLDFPDCPCAYWFHLDPDACFENFFFELL